MSSGNSRNVARVRTFNDDVSRVRGETTGGVPTMTPTGSVPATPTPPAVTLKPITQATKPATGTDETRRIPTAPLEEVGVPHVSARTTDDTESLIPPIKPSTMPRPHVTNASDATIDSPIISDALKTVATTSFGSVGTPSFDAEDDPFGAEGTIVTDKRRNRFRLLPAIGTAVSDWAGDTKATLTRSKVPQHVVTKAESRVETLKAAAKQSYQPPQDDHGVVIKRLTEKARTPVTTKVNIKAASAVPTPTWTHVADPSAATNEEAAAVSAPEVSVPEVTPAPRTVSIPVKAAATVPQPATMPAPRVSPPAPASAPLVRETVSATPVVYATKPTPVSQPVVVRKLEPMIPFETVPTVPEPAVSRSQPAQQPPVPTAPVIVETPAPRAMQTPVTEVPPALPPRTKQDGRRLLVIFITIVVGASFLGVGVAALWYLRVTPTVTETPTVNIPSLVSVSTSTPVPLRSERSELFRELSAATAATTETQQLYLVTDDSTAVSQPADISTILTQLAFRAPGSFTRSIKALTFGSHAGSAPFLVLHVTDFNTAFAGMLQWETNLSADLAPLFGTVVTESFDPTARTDTQLRPAFFRDTIVANVSTRLLVDNTNDERMLYGFVKPNIILITTNQTTFKAVAPLINTAP